MQRITIRNPDDFHTHLRQGDLMTGYEKNPGTIHYTVDGGFRRALVMPNLKPPVTKPEQALAYYQQIKAIDSGFHPIMTLYLTDETTAQDVHDAHATGIIKAFKLYPANATTNSAAGVTNLAKCQDAIDAMNELGMVLCIHGELLIDQYGKVDIFERESRFLVDVLFGLMDSNPGLKVVLEHITTGDAVDFVLHAPETWKLGATITAHHLLANRNAIFEGNAKNRSGVNPHHFCLPILKKEDDRKCLLVAATSGNPRFFAGTDSAPHLADTKYTSCGCAGCFTSSIALPLYATAFDQVGKIDTLEAFTSQFGAQFYRLPLNEGTVTLVREKFVIPEVYTLSDTVVVPFWAGEAIPWKILKE